MFLKYALNLAVKCNSPLYSPVRNAAFVRDVYKMINYTAPFSISEKELILQKLNSYSAKEFEAHITKIAARKIVEHRSKNGNFEKVEQLLDLDKIETVTLEKYCRFLLRDLSEIQSTTGGINQVLKYLSKDIKPHIREYKPSSTILGLKVNVNTVSYALINNRDLLDWGTLNLADENAKINSNSLAHNVLFFKTQELVKTLPEADFCVEEETLKVLARDSYMVLKFNIMKTKAYVDCILHQTGNIKSNVIHHMQPRVLDKLFELNVGNERVSMSVKFPQIMKDNFEEDAPFFLNISSQQMSDLKESNSREFIVGACLQALAFRLAAQTKLKKDE